MDTVKKIFSKIYQEIKECFRVLKDLIYPLFIAFVFLICFAGVICFVINQHRDILEKRAVICGAANVAVDQNGNYMLIYNNEDVKFVLTGSK